jgi:beta-glucosidase/6-phospho-beta-glucosidase/beta-galactosidase
MCGSFLAGGAAPVVNQEGVAYYNNLINGLLKKGSFRSIFSLIISLIFASAIF